MLRTILKSKLHKATVTATDFDYQGSITIDETLMKKADLLAGEKVEVFNMANGVRFETYVIKGKKGSGEICVNGPAVYLCSPGDKVIVVAYYLVEDKKAHLVKPRIIYLDERNRPQD